MSASRYFRRSIYLRVYVRFGSLAVIRTDITPMTAFRGKADIHFRQISNFRWPLTATSGRSELLRGRPTVFGRHRFPFFQQADFLYVS